MTWMDNVQSQPISQNPSSNIFQPYTYNVLSYENVLFWTGPHSNVLHESWHFFEIRIRTNYGLFKKHISTLRPRKLWYLEWGSKHWLGVI